MILLQAKRNSTKILIRNWSKLALCQILKFRFHLLLRVSSFLPWPITILNISLRSSKSTHLSQSACGPVTRRSFVFCPLNPERIVDSWCWSLSISSLLEFLSVCRKSIPADPRQTRNQWQFHPSCLPSEWCVFSYPARLIKHLYTKLLSSSFSVEF